MVGRNRSLGDHADMLRRSLQIRLLQAGDLLANIFKQIAGMALIGIGAICAVNVGARYLFSNAFTWAEEAMVYMMIFVVVSGSITATWKGVHLKLDLVLRKLPDRLQRLVVIVTTLASSALLLTLALYSQQVVSRLFRYGQTSDALKIPMWVPQSVMMVGLYLIAAVMILRLLTIDPLSADSDFAEEDFTE